MPNILVLSINRFKRENTHFSEKVNDHVSCPVDGLDISEFVLNKKGDGKYLYDLTGVVNHFGGLQGGHYTSYAKNSVTNAWYEYNDGQVSKVYQSEDVVSDAAYIFFFKRRGFAEEEEFDFSLIRNELTEETMEDEKPRAKIEAEEPIVEIEEEKVEENEEPMPWDEAAEDEDMIIKPELHEVEMDGNGFPTMEMPVEEVQDTTDDAEYARKLQEIYENDEPSPEP